MPSSSTIFGFFWCKLNIGQLDDNLDSAVAIVSFQIHGILGEFRFRKKPRVGDTKEPGPCHVEEIAFALIRIIFIFIVFHFRTILFKTSIESGVLYRKGNISFANAPPIYEVAKGTES